MNLNVLLGNTPDVIIADGQGAQPSPSDRGHHGLQSEPHLWLCPYFHNSYQCVVEILAFGRGKGLYAAASDGFPCRSTDVAFQRSGRLGRAGLPARQAG